MLNTDTKNYMTIQWNGGLRYYKEDSQSYNNMIELIEKMQQIEANPKRLDYYKKKLNQQKRSNIWAWAYTGFSFIYDVFKSAILFDVVEFVHD
ncbi:hypothetical protein pb186bvf_000787 [Paramecium bursaria]